jgi:hypothetical protein
MICLLSFYRLQDFDPDGVDLIQKLVVMDNGLFVRTLIRNIKGTREFSSRSGKGIRKNAEVMLAEFDIVVTVALQPIDTGTAPKPDNGVKLAHGVGGVKELNLNGFIRMDGFHARKVVIEGTGFFFTDARIACDFT